MTKHKKPYPAWVCSDCGEKYGRRIPSLSTYHIGVCGVCSKETMVTEPRDYGHLNFEVKLSDDWGRVNSDENYGGGWGG